MTDFQKNDSKEYIKAWTKNSKQHYDDGDYDWLCNLIEPYYYVLEIGCGAGLSTLALVQREHRVLSVDINTFALQNTKDLLTENSYIAKIVTESVNLNENNVCLWNADVVVNRYEINAVTSQLCLDLILLCNPGGNLNSNLLKTEVELLKQYGFTQEEIDFRYKQNAIPLLHKYSMISAAADIAINAKKPLVIVERGDKTIVNNTLEQIAIDTGMTLVSKIFREIQKITRRWNTTWRH